MALAVAIRSVGDNAFPSAVNAASVGIPVATSSSANAGAASASRWLRIVRARCKAKVAWSSEWPA